jgi:hypothetical protein
VVKVKYVLLTVAAVARAVVFAAVVNVAYAPDATEAEVETLTSDGFVITWFVVIVARKEYPVGKVNGMMFELPLLE